MVRFAYFYLMSSAFNPSQLEFLKVLEHLKDESDLAELKSLLVAYLSDKVVRNADAAFDAKGYTTEIFETWRKEHFRKPARP